MPLQPGSRLGPYEIVAPLGTGGMGEVYRARDTNLNRHVALKVVLPVVAADPDRLARFRREAQLLASLNHPNIAHIHGLEETSAATAIVLELVDGEDLAQRIARGPLPLAEALAIARQVAEALEAAHEQGIIHRDLKPANIKIRPDGAVKVLDFGLAKAVESPAASGPGGGLSMSPTLSIHATQAGVILGTAAYMSPEQAAGKPVDRRSDMWAFGAVLFEMLTGRPAFEGETVSHVIASVLKDSPDLDALPAGVPPPIRRLLRRCLEKDRKNRLADAGDARLEIDDALRSPGIDAVASAAIPPAGLSARSTWRMLPVAFLAGALLAGGAALIGIRGRTAAPAAPALTYTPLSFEPGGNSSPVWSPDGKGIAFAARQQEDRPYQLYVRYLDSSVSTQFTHLATGATPIAWTTGGRIVLRAAAAPAGLWSISQTGGEPEPLLALELTATIPDVTADGSAIAYYGRRDGKSGLWISAPAGSTPHLYQPAPFEAGFVTNVPVVRFSPDGKQLLLIRNAGQGEEAWLMPYPADPNRPPRPVFGDSLAESTGTPQFSWMPDSRRVVLSIATASEPSRLYLADIASGAVTLLSSATTAQREPSVAPDGTRVAFREAVTDANVIQVDVQTGAVSPVLAGRRADDMPAWSIRADVMAYVTDRSGVPEVWLREAGRPDRPVVTPRDFPPGTTQSFMTPSVSPDGARVIYGRVERGGELLAMWVSSVSGGAPVRVTTAAARGEEAPGAWSPDGAWFVYWDRKPGAVSLNRVRTTGRAQPEILIPKVTPTGSAVPVWSPSGDWILHDNGGWRLLSPDGKTERDLDLRASVCTFSRDGSTLFCFRQELSQASAGARGGVLFSRAPGGGPEHVIARLTSTEAPRTQLTPALRMTVAPDGRSLTFSAIRFESSLWLLGGIAPPAR